MLIPIGHEDQQVTRLPWVTIVLLVANVLVFLLTNQVVQQQATETRQRLQGVARYAAEHPYLRLPPEIQHAVPSAPPKSDLDPDMVAQQQAKLDAMWEEFKSAASPGVFRTYGYIPAKPSLLALFTSMFLHAGWMHLLSNMLFLWLAGASLEDRWGRLFYLLLYLAGGVVAALIHAAMNPQSAIPMVGASGAISGLMGAFLVRLAATRIRFFYWFLVVRGTFLMPAYVALPLWLLQQFAMARSGAAGRIAVWAHIGGFIFGALVAGLVKLSDFEKNILAPAIAKRTSWSPSEQLTSALGKLDRNDADGSIQDLVALLTRSPNSIEGRAALVAAYTQKGDTAAAGRESARLVSAYVVGRDLDGALAALEEHRRAHPDVPVAMRSLLTLAAHREKESRHREAADLYHKAIQAWPDDPLLPKALIAYGRLMLEVFQQPADTLAILEGALANPRTTPEFRRAAEELMAAARRAGAAVGDRTEPAAAPAEFEATSLTAPVSVPALEGPISSPGVATLSQEMESAAAGLQPEARRGAEPVAEPTEPAATQLTLEGPALEPPADVEPEPVRAWKLAPAPMRAIAVETRGLRLQSLAGKVGQLPWQSVVAVAVARIGVPAPADQSVEGLILDLVMAPQATGAEDVVRCVRLTATELAIPQLQAEASPVRGFQRLVATILKATGASPYPTREDCVGLRGFPAFSDADSYETALLACLRLAAR
jgi:membrane associated rhomboid family serine protease